MNIELDNLNDAKGHKITLKTTKGIGLKQKLAEDEETCQHRCAIENQWFFVSKNARARRAIRKLMCVTSVCFMFMTVEIVGGILSGSLAILTDAAHQLSDVAGFVISFLAIYMSTKKGNMNYTFGYHRADVVGACGSILIIWILLLYLCYEAIWRIKHLDLVNIDARIMLITSILGLGCNILNWATLEYCCNDTDDKDERPEHNFSIASQYNKFSLSRASFGSVGKNSDGRPAEEVENLNVRAAVIHMLGDMITSLGVILAAVIIYFKPEWKIADPICTFFFSVLVLFTTLPVMGDSMRILMEGAPEELDQNKVFNSLNAVSNHPA